jgi:CRISPR-associated protein Csm2
MSNYFYEDPGKKKIKEDLILKSAQDWAQRFVKPKNEKDKQLSSSQLRKFHFEVKQMEERSRAMDNTEFLVKVRPLVKMLKSKVAYACRTPGRDRKVPEDFKNYVDTMVDNIKDINDFKAFAICFEAVVGYFYGLGGGKIK